MALKTLDGMHDGIYDKIDFGFFRYSVTQDWKMPHYEKMLDTNAGLLRNYAVAYGITNNEKYKKTAKELIEYVNNFLSSENGGFYGSQDADEEFYHSKPEERKSYRNEVSGELKNQRFLSNKSQPFVDKTIYVDWNAMMASSYIKAGAVLNEQKAVDFAILRNFYDGKNHGFFDRILKDNDLGALKHRNKQFLENSFCAIAFLRLHFLTKEGMYRELAENTLLYFADSYLNFGYFAANYAAAVDMLLNQETNQKLNK